MGFDEQVSAPHEKAAETAKWAVIMTKVAIRRAVRRKAFPKWHLVTFNGPHGSESTGIVDMVAIRKDHSKPSDTQKRDGLKRGDLLKIALIQIKGGSAAKPTDDDAKRLGLVQRQHDASIVLLASWTKGRAVVFHTFSVAI